MHTSRRGSDPVFVDRSGRRRRLFALAGSAGGLVLILVAVALFAAFTGDGPAPIPGWPATAGHAKPPASRAPSAGPGAPDPLSAPPQTPPAGASAATTPAAMTGPTAAAPVATSASPTSASSVRRRDPSHSPTPHPTKSR